MLLTLFSTNIALFSINQNKQSFDVNLMSQSPREWKLGPITRAQRKKLKIHEDNGMASGRQGLEDHTLSRTVGSTLPSSVGLGRKTCLIHIIVHYLKFSHYAANHAIFVAFQGNDIVHVIEYNLMKGLPWITLIKILTLPLEDRDS
ncbi:hypothetical protein M9H77_18715 [Catharanthus roseus]|uniref:Uncharacterized protein n=1 Tax=Catharanthus roseus TaxID=4058 RepID=A0ACC0B8A7_CATRO|nr:hypothetical protein M9H77_18715 [Catharanthus roseus]